MPIVKLRYSRKGATSKAWARSESTNDGRARQPKWKRAAGDRAAEGRGEHWWHWRARDAADGESTTPDESNQSKGALYCRREPGAPCRDEKMVASLLRSRSACNTTYGEPVTCTTLAAAGGLQAPTMKAASSAEFLGGPAGMPDVVHRRQVSVSAAQPGVEHHNEHTNTLAAAWAVWSVPSCFFSSIACCHASATQRSAMQPPRVSPPMAAADIQQPSPFALETPNGPLSPP